jgi:uncharacterized membrane protein YkoI
MPIRRMTLRIILLAMLPLASVQAFDLEQALREAQPQAEWLPRPDYRTTQGDGKSLAEAIESVRNKTNGRIVSAETRVSGGREMHYIKVLTKDGKVKTHKVPGRKRGKE